MIKNKLINKLKKNKSFLYLFSFSFISNILLRLKIIEKILKKLNFNNLIKFFLLLGYDKNYTKYLLLRKKIPSYYIALILNEIINKNKLLIDFGCGFGHSLKNLSKNQIKIGIDKDFLSLYFNLNYKEKNTFFICYDFDNKKLPFKKNSINQFIFIDGLYSIKNQFLFLKEIKRIIKNNSSGYISQILSKKVKTFKEYNLSNPKTIEKYLKKLKFNNFKIIPSSIIWHSLKNKQILNLNQNFVLKNKRIYNIIIFPNKIKNLKIDLVFNLYKKTKINFYQDNDLLLDLKSDYKYE